jgi:DNA-directed RNA polymerase specialized sigma24 family protein
MQRCRDVLGHVGTLSRGTAGTPLSAVDGGHCPEAEDALSEAYLRAWQGWMDSTQQINNVPGWLSRLVQHHCRNLHIIQTRQTRVVQGVADLAQLDAAVAVPWSSSPEGRCLDHELGRYIHQSMDACPHAYRRQHASTLSRIWPIP